MTVSSATTTGGRLNPQVLDELAATDPQRVYAAIPKTANVEEGYTDLTMADLARCVDFAAGWLASKFGKSDNFETITYIGLSDVRGIIMLLAAVKVGYKLFVPSPRLPASVISQLMARVNSDKVLYVEELAPLFKSVQNLAPSATYSDIPSINDMLHAETEHYPYTKAFEEAKDDPIIILHSSGSTGLPKPITITHGSMSAYDRTCHLPLPDGRIKNDSSAFSVNGPQRLYLVLPFFHLGGFIFFYNHAILDHFTLVLSPPHIAPDATLLQQIAQQTKLDSIMVVPAVLETFLNNAQSMNFLKCLESVGCAGAPLSGHVGDRIAEIVKLRIFIGSTETFPLPELEKAPEDWQYHEFNPNLKHRMQANNDGTGTFELVILADEADRATAPVIHNLPGENPHYTKDLYTQHKTKPNLYKYYGRRDDIIILANGEKINPIPFEQLIQGDPELKGVLVVGNNRVQTALIIEPRESLDESGREQLLKRIQLIIDGANKTVPGPARVARGMVLCALTKNPFARTAKNTVIRRLTEDAYSKDLERLYSYPAQDEKLISISLKPTVKTIYEQKAIIEFLRQVIAASLPLALAFDEDEDFFSHGLDSIQVLEVTANLKRNLEGLTSNSTAWISPRVIYQHSTLSDLSKVIAVFLNDGQAPVEDFHATQIRDINDAVARHVANLPHKIPQREVVNSTAESGISVAIIGSTGYVGTNALAALLRNPTIQHIYGLNRGSDASQRQTTALHAVDNSLHSFSSKLTFFPVKLGAPKLGLDEAQYNIIADNVDVVVFNAWRLDFGLAIQSFDPFLRATRDLVELSVSSRREMHIIFISSISSVISLAANGAPVPEAVVEDPLAASPTGYGQSKLAAERILAAAQRESGVPVSIIRVGQVGGTSQVNTTHHWADQPWISAIISTSKSLGLFPSSVMPIDWIPVDTLATIIEKVIIQPTHHHDSLQVYNVASQPQSWQLLVDVLRDIAPECTKEMVPLQDWVNAIKKMTDPSPEDIEKLPALRLLEFYTSLNGGIDSAKIATDSARAISGTGLAPLTQEQLGSWLETWSV